MSSTPVGELDGRPRVQLLLLAFETAGDDALDVVAAGGGDDSVHVDVDAGAVVAEYEYDDCFGDTAESTVPAVAEDATLPKLKCRPGLPPFFPRCTLPPPPKLKLVSPPVLLLLSSLKLPLPLLPLIKSMLLELPPLLPVQLPLMLLELLALLALIVGWIMAGLGAGNGAMGDIGGRGGRAVRRN